jgi:hypothetical protein
MNASPPPASPTPDSLRMTHVCLTSSCLTHFWLTKNELCFTLSCLSQNDWLMTHLFLSPLYVVQPAGDIHSFQLLAQTLLSHLQLTDLSASPKTRNTFFHSLIRFRSLVQNNIRFIWFSVNTSVSQLAASPRSKKIVWKHCDDMSTCD